MAERPNFEDLDGHALEVLRTRNENVVLAPWQLRLIVDHITFLREQVGDLEVLVASVRRDRDDPEPTFE